MPRQPKKGPPPRACSSAWVDDLKRGKAYPRGMVRCPVCGYDQPPIHFASSGRCFDCTDETRPAPVPAAPARAKTDTVGEALLAVLTPDEVSLLAGYLHDRTPQGELAEQTRSRQTTVSARIRRAIRKAAAAGVTIIRLPDRRTSRPPWVPQRPRMLPTDPQTLGRLVTAREDGRLRGRWVEAKEPQRQAG